MHYLLTAAYIFTCLLLLVVVLLQQGKGGDIAAAFGGASSQTAFGARAGATVLTRATTILGALFMVGAFALTIYSRSGGGSVVGGVGAPITAPAPPELPTGGVLPTPPGTGSGSGSDPATTPPPAGTGGATGSGSTPPVTPPATPPPGRGSGSN